MEDVSNTFSMKNHVMLDISCSVNRFPSVRLISGEAYDQMAQSSIMHKSLQLLSGNKEVKHLLQYFTFISSLWDCFCDDYTKLKDET